MATWIKMQVGLENKAEIAVLSRIWGVNFDETIGILFRFWCWADQNSVDGNVRSVTLFDLDVTLRRENFSAAMVQVGWLHQENGKVTLPNFERHNGQSAKKRALTQERVHKIRRENCNAGCVTKALPEKRREEKNIIKPIVLKNELQKDIEVLLRRKETTPWSKKELKSLKENLKVIEATTQEQWQKLRIYYKESPYARKDLGTLINNWNGEIDRAMSFQTKPEEKQFEKRISASEYID